MTEEKKRILICDEHPWHVGLLSKWLYTRYSPFMATNLERSRYQFLIHRFDLVVADLKGFEAWQWLIFLEGTQQPVLYLGLHEVTGRPHLIKPSARHFAAFREPFLKKVADMLGTGD